MGGNPAFLIFLVLALVALVIWGDLPGGARLFQALQNAAHAPVFVAITLIVTRLLQGRRGIAFAVCLFLGIAIEGVQALIGRDAEFQDVITDAIGIAMALAYLGRKRKPAIAWTVVLAGGVITLAPVIASVAAYADRAIQFPVLAAFGSPLRLPEGEWPGVTLDEPFPDWSGYTTLVVRLTNKESQPLPLTIRVHDRDHTQEVDDRYNRPFVLPPQTSLELRIALNEIETAPRTRRMDMRHIAGIIIFAARENAGRSFYLDEIRLDSN